MKILKYVVHVKLKDKIDTTEEFVADDEPINARRKAIRKATSFMDVVQDSADAGEITFRSDNTLLAAKDKALLEISVDVVYENENADTIYYPVNAANYGTMKLFNALLVETDNYQKESYDLGGESWIIHHPKRGPLYLLRDDYTLYHDTAHPLSTYLKSIPTKDRGT
jgi:hypothetical protein